MSNSNTVGIIEKIISVCNDSLETDSSRPEFCECGRELTGVLVDLWKPIDRSNTYMIRNTLQSLLDCGEIKNA